jgi:hypothetical protein
MLHVILKQKILQNEAEVVVGGGEGRGGRYVSHRGREI